MRRFFAVAALLCPILLRAEGSPRAADLSNFFLGLPVTNTILTSWIVVFLFLIAFRFFVGNARMVPGKAQAVVEEVVIGLRDLLAPIVGGRAMPVAFPVLFTLFVFILVQNWVGLLPGVGTIGWGSGASFFHTHVETPLIRPPTSDLNGTAALAIFSFVAWIFMILKYAGPRVILKDWFGNKAEKRELAAPIYWTLSIVFLLVGAIEILSILIRPVALSIRLFGNVFGGENLLHATFFTPPFYFMELLVGAVQAFVFTLLSAVYIGLICNHGEEHAEENAR